MVGRTISPLQSPNSEKYSAKCDLSSGGKVIYNEKHSLITQPLTITNRVLLPSKVSVNHSSPASGRGNFLLSKSISSKQVGELLRISCGGGGCSRKFIGFHNNIKRPTSPPARLDDLLNGIYCNDWNQLFDANINNNREQTEKGHDPLISPSCTVSSDSPTSGAGGFSSIPSDSPSISPASAGNLNSIGQLKGDEIGNEDDLQMGGQLLSGDTPVSRCRGKTYRSIAYKTWTMNGVRKLNYSTSDFGLAGLQNDYENSPPGEGGSRHRDFLSARNDDICNQNSHSGRFGPISNGKSDITAGAIDFFHRKAASETPLMARGVTRKRHGSAGSSTDKSTSSPPLTPPKSSVIDLLNISCSSCSDNESSDCFSAADYARFQLKMRKSDTLETFRSDMEHILSNTCDDLQRFIDLTNTYSLTLRSSQGGSSSNGTAGTNGTIGTNHNRSGSDGHLICGEEKDVIVSSSPISGTYHSSTISSGQIGQFYSQRDDLGTIYNQRTRAAWPNRTNGHGKLSGLWDNFQMLSHSAGSNGCSSNGTNKICPQNSHSDCADMSIDHNLNIESQRGNVDTDNINNNKNNNYNYNCSKNSSYNCRSNSFNGGMYNNSPSIIPVQYVSSRLQHSRSNVEKCGSNSQCKIPYGTIQKRVPPHKHAVGRCYNSDKAGHSRGCKYVAEQGLNKNLKLPSNCPPTHSAQHNQINANAAPALCSRGDSLLDIPPLQIIQPQNSHLPPPIDPQCRPWGEHDSRNRSMHPDAPSPSSSSLDSSLSMVSSSSSGLVSNDHIEKSKSHISTGSGQKCELELCTPVIVVNSTVAELVDTQTNRPRIDSVLSHDFSRKLCSSPVKSIHDFSSSDDAVEYLKIEMEKIRTKDVALYEQLKALQTQLERLRSELLSPSDDYETDEDSLEYDADSDGGEPTPRQLPPIPRCLQQHSHELLPIKEKMGDRKEVNGFEENGGQMRTTDKSHNILQSGHVVA